jgi:sulfide:quinone oxidoreductase
MRRLVVLGAGTAGTMVVNKLRSKLRDDEWSIAVVDQDDQHVYQPGLLALPFGESRMRDLVKPRSRFVPGGVDFVRSRVERVDPDARAVELADGRTVRYDYLVIATGTSPRPDQVPGMAEGIAGGCVHEFYTPAGAERLREALRAFDSGRLVVHVTEMPIKCPVAPLEFTFLADAWFAERGMRDRVELTYVTPLEGAFTRPIASGHLGGMLDERKVHVEPDFVVDSIDPGGRTLVSVDERRIGYDLLVTVPLNMGADFVARSGLGDELNYVPVDRHTLLSTTYDTIFALGDASDVPASKAGSTAHFEVELFTENFLDHVAGRPMTRSFDGHANCFVEAGHGRALLIDFNYDTEPLRGRYPLPVVGPFRLLEESRVNHLGKRAFRWMYWNLLLRGRPVPVPALMSMAGKTAAAPPAGR